MPTHSRCVSVNVTNDCLQQKTCYTKDPVFAQGGICPEGTDSNSGFADPDFSPLPPLCFRACVALLNTPLSFWEEPLADLGESSPMSRTLGVRLGGLLPGRLLAMDAMETLLLLLCIPPITKGAGSPGIT